MFKRYKATKISVYTIERIFSENTSSKSIFFSTNLNNEERKRIIFFTFKRRLLNFRLKLKKIIPFLFSMLTFVRLLSYLWDLEKQNGVGDSLMSSYWGRRGIGAGKGEKTQRGDQFLWGQLTQIYTKKSVLTM